MQGLTNVVPRAPDSLPPIIGRGNRTSTPKISKFETTNTTGFPKMAARTLRIGKTSPIALNATIYNIIPLHQAHFHSFSPFLNHSMTLAIQLLSTKPHTNPPHRPHPRRRHRPRSDSSRASNPRIAAHIPRAKILLQQPLSGVVNLPIDRRRLTRRNRHSAAIVLRRRALRRRKLAHRANEGVLEPHCRAPQAHEIVCQCAAC